MSVVLGAHLLGHADVSVPTTRGTAAALGRVQPGEVEQEILVNMWADWGLRGALEESLESPAGVGPGWAHAGARARGSANIVRDSARFACGRGDTCMHIRWVGRPWQRLVRSSRAWTRPTYMYVFPDAALVCARTGAPYRCGPCTAGTALALSLPRGH